MPDSKNKGTSSGQTMRPSEVKRELNEQFRLAHPEIMPEITLSKIRSIKNHLVEIGKAVDLEISSVAHAFVYFEKLVIKVRMSIIFKIECRITLCFAECRDKTKSQTYRCMLLVPCNQSQ